MNGYPLQVSCGPRFDDNYHRIRHDFLAVEATEAHDVSVDASEGDGESKKSNSERIGLLVLIRNSAPIVSTPF